MSRRQAGAQQANSWIAGGIPQARFEPDSKGLSKFRPGRHEYTQELRRWLPTRRISNRFLCFSVPVMAETGLNNVLSSFQLENCCGRSAGAETSVAPDRRKGPPDGTPGRRNPTRNDHGWRARATTARNTTLGTRSNWATTTLARCRGSRPAGIDAAGASWMRIRLGRKRCHGSGI